MIYPMPSSFFGLLADIERRNAEAKRKRERRERQGARISAIFAPINAPDLTDADGASRSEPGR